MAKKSKKQATKRVPTDAQLAKVKWSKELPMVRVTWHDATSVRGKDIYHARQDAYCIKAWILGYLIRRDKKFVVVAREVFSPDRVAHVLTIPASWVTKIEMLEISK